MIEGDKLTALLKHGASIHIIEPGLGIDYYGSLERSEEEQKAGHPIGALAVRLDIPVGKFVDTRPSPDRYFSATSREPAASITSSPPIMRLPSCRIRSGILTSRKAPSGFSCASLSASPFR